MNGHYAWYISYTHELLWFSWLYHDWLWYSVFTGAKLCWAYCPTYFFLLGLCSCNSSSSNNCYCYLPPECWQQKFCYEIPWSSKWKLTTVKIDKNNGWNSNKENCFRYDNVTWLYHHYLGEIRTLYLQSTNKLSRNNPDVYLIFMNGHCAV